MIETSVVSLNLFWINNDSLTAAPTINDRFGSKYIL